VAEVRQGAHPNAITTALCDPKKPNCEYSCCLKLSIHDSRRNVKAILAIRGNMKIRGVGEAGNLNFLPAFA
jgi:hypothetical protein